MTSPGSSPQVDWAMKKKQTSPGLGREDLGVVQHGSQPLQTNATFLQEREAAVLGEQCVQNLLRMSTALAWRNAHRSNGALAFSEQIRKH